MLSNRVVLVALTAIAPVVWGTTYLTTTTFLPPGHPLLIATVRALPAGLILLLAARRLPTGSWWWRSWVLGALNFTAFFGCLFVAADRLPGGVAAVVGGIQPLLVAVLGWRMLSERLTVVTVVAGAAGVVGVGLIVAPGGADLDPVGIAAALGGAVSMAVGTVLTKRWGSGQPPLAMTAWQLVTGGLMLAMLTFLVEPLPDALPSVSELGAYAYLTLIGTALAYVLWFRGVRSLPTRLPDGAEQVLDVDNVVLCAGQESLRELEAELLGAGVAVHRVGGADVAAELDAKRAIDQATRLAAEL